MAYKIAFTQRFKKHFKKFSETEKKQIKRKLGLLGEDPFHPSLRTKKINKGNDVFEFSVNMDIRITWFYESDSIIIALDIGHHDILDRL